MRWYFVPVGLENPCITVSMPYMSDKGLGFVHVEPFLLVIVPQTDHVIAPLAQVGCFGTMVS